VYKANGEGVVGRVYSRSVWRTGCVPSDDARKTRGKLTSLGKKLRLLDGACFEVVVVDETEACGHRLCAVGVVVVNPETFSI